MLVARAFSRAYGLRLTTRGEMQYAYDGERMTPSQVGAAVPPGPSLLPQSCQGAASAQALCATVRRARAPVCSGQLLAHPPATAAPPRPHPAPPQCGKMDQACAFGSTPVLMTYDGDVLSVAPARLGAPLHLVLVDLRAGKDTVAILAALQVGGAGRE